MALTLLLPSVPPFSSMYILGTLAILGLLYWLALPRPLPGIPFNKEASKSLLGDVPSLLTNLKQTSDFFDWIRTQCIQLQSPIFQVFPKPFARPLVVVADFREAHDISLRRTPRDFDRSPFLINIFRGILPQFTISMPTNESFKANRRMFQDTMSFSFLRRLAAPHLCVSGLELVKLWRLKALLAEGHAFRADEDLSHGVLDAMWAATFGPHTGAIDAHLKLLSSIQTLNVPGDRDAAVEMPKPCRPVVYEAFKTLADTVEVMTQSLSPRAHHFLLRQFPKYRSARAIKDRFIRDKIQQARTKLAKGLGDDAGVDSAVDLVIQREMQTLKKNGETIPEASLEDELLGFLTASHDTTATTLSWGVKLLADHPAAQESLREELQAAFPNATQGHEPSSDEILQANLPIIDATIEEILRVGLTEPGTARVAVRDTEILGHHIPQGTEIILLHNGPSYLQPAMAIEEGIRSAGSRSAKDKTGEWEADGVASFEPRRWLVLDEAGKPAYNPSAGPTLPFGAGLRGCFGKKLAYIEMRLMLTLIILNFELQHLPANLNSYAGVLGITRSPRQCYIRLKAL